MTPTLILMIALLIACVDLHSLCSEEKQFTSHVYYVCASVMSDTSIISRASFYRNSRTNYDDEESSCCAHYWFSLINSLLLLITLITSVLLVYFVNKHGERDRERQRLKDEFKRKNGVTNKILDLIMKDGIIHRWIKGHKGLIAITFHELFKDIAETLFDE